MITPDAKPIGNRNPYKRVDLARRKRKPFITREDIQNGEPAPDPAFYDGPDWYGNWALKEGQ